MKLVASVLLMSSVVGALLASGPPLSAADQNLTSSAHVKIWRYNAQPQGLPFARGKRAQAIWASDTCWNTCGGHCTWDMAGCLQHDAQGHCLKITDRCDRACQLQCRTKGGPFLPIE